MTSIAFTLDSRPLFLLYGDSITQLGSKVPRKANYKFTDADLFLSKCSNARANTPFHLIRPNPDANPRRPMADGAPRVGSQAAGGLQRKLPRRRRAQSWLLWIQHTMGAVAAPVPDCADELRTKYMYAVFRGKRLGCDRLEAARTPGGVHRESR